MPSRTRNIFITLLATLFIAALLPGARLQADVGLLYFRAQNNPDQVTLLWRTATELDNLGFNLRRASAQAPDCSLGDRLNEEMIASQVAGQPIGAEYSFVDSSGESGIIYAYWLESIAIQGSSRCYGPLLAGRVSGDAVATLPPSNTATPLPTATDTATPVATATPAAGAETVTATATLPVDQATATPTATATLRGLPPPPPPTSLPPGTRATPGDGTVPLPSPQPTAGQSGNDADGGVITLPTFNETVPPLIVDSGTQPTAVTPHPAVLPGSGAEAVTPVAVSSPDRSQLLATTQPLGRSTPSGSAGDNETATAVPGSRTSLVMIIGLLAGLLLLVSGSVATWLLLRSHPANPAE